MKLWYFGFCISLIIRSVETAFCCSVENGFESDDMKCADALLVSFLQDFVVGVHLRNCRPTNCRARLIISNQSVDGLNLSHIAPRWKLIWAIQKTYLVIIGEYCFICGLR